MPESRLPGIGTVKPMDLPYPGLDHSGLAGSSQFRTVFWHQRVGSDDLTGAVRVRERDRGHPLASSITLNRLKPGTPEEMGATATIGSLPMRM